MINVFGDVQDEWLALPEVQKEYMVAYLYLIRTADKIEDCDSTDFFKKMSAWTAMNGLTVFHVPKKMHIMPVNKLKKRFDISIIKNK